MRVPVSVRVLDTQGRPVAGATLAVEQAAGPVPEIGHRADQHGRARIGLPPGQAMVRAFGPNRETGTAEFTVAADSNPEIVVRLESK